MNNNDDYQKLVWYVDEETVKIYQECLGDKTYDEAIDGLKLYARAQSTAEPAPGQLEIRPQTHEKT